MGASVTLSHTPSSSPALFSHSGVKVISCDMRKHVLCLSVLCRLPSSASLLRPHQTQCLLPTPPPPPPAPPHHPPISAALINIKMPLGPPEHLRSLGWPGLCPVVLHSEALQAIDFSSTHRGFFLCHRSLCKKKKSERVLLRLSEKHWGCDRWIRTREI